MGTWMKDGSVFLGSFYGEKKREGKKSRISNRPRSVSFPRGREGKGRENGTGGGRFFLEFLIA